MGDDGEWLTDKEFATHCSEPEGDVGLMIGHFLDETSHAIPGMVSVPIPVATTMKRPAANGVKAGPPAKRRSEIAKVVKRRPAGATSSKAPLVQIASSDDSNSEDDEEEDSESEVDKAEEMEPEEDGEDGGEENIESEVGFEPDEAIVPDEEEHHMTMNYFVTTGGLQGQVDLNDRHFMVVEDARADGRVRIKEIPCTDSTDGHWCKQENLTRIETKDAMKFFKAEITINDTTFTIRGTPQGSRSPLILVKSPDTQLGSVVVRPSMSSPVVAWKIAMDVMTEMQYEFDQFEALPTKEAFFEKRDRLL